MNGLTPEAVAVIRSRVALQGLSWRDAVAAAQSLNAEYPNAEVGAWERRGGFGLAARYGSATVAGSIDEVSAWLAENYDVPGRAGRPGQAEG